jgi:hypothetical protein
MIKIQGIIQKFVHMGNKEERTEMGNKEMRIEMGN